MKEADRFDELVAEAEGRRLEGWDFSFLEGRFEVEPSPWDYRARVEAIAAGARTMVDLGTGGGEFLAALDVRAPLTLATEGWMPNLAVAGRNLRPRGIHVVAVEGAPDNAAQRFTDASGRLPFRNGALDLVVDRHEAFRATEVARVLRSGGMFLTQQVGGRNEIELNMALGDVLPCASPTLDEYVSQLARAGFRVIDAREAFPAKRYLDVGAVVAFLRAVPWQYESFDTRRHRAGLRAIHDTIRERGAFAVRMHRFLLEAVNA